MKHLHVMKKNIDPISLLQEYYDTNSVSYTILLQHSCLVASKAVQITRKRNKKYWTTHPEKLVDERFIYEAAMLHDIGIYCTHAPKFWCTGKMPYLHHTVHGYEILTEKGLDKHARVALTHTWCWLQHTYIKKNNLSLPLMYSYIPETIEEKIISFADLFYWKVPKKNTGVVAEKSIKSLRKTHYSFEEEQWKTFDERYQIFHTDLLEINP